MPKMETLSVEVSAEVASQVRDAVARGEYPSESAVLTEALLGWTIRHGAEIDPGWLKQAWDEAGDEELDADEVLDRLKAKYLALCDAPAAPAA